MATMLNFLGYAMLTLFLIFVCVLLIVGILVLVEFTLVEISDLWQEWREINED